MARYIDADIAMAYFDRFEKYNGECYFDSVSEAVTEFEEIIDDVPTADVAPVVHSKWEICCDGYYPYCKNCRNEPQGRVMTKYCPNCGAKMDEEVNNT